MVTILKKSVLVLILIMAFLVSGCVNQKNNNVEQNNASSHAVTAELSEYIASVKERADAVRNSLEQDALTQTDMNVKSQELYGLWDGALNYLLGELQTSLPEDEFAKLQDEQRTWLVQKEQAMEMAGKEFEGGSLYPLIVNSEAARITEERVYELYSRLTEKGAQ